MHDGQIALPYPGGKVRLAHPTRAVRDAASTAAPAAVMHVSPGLGTTFVPFRFAARPEATELVLRSPHVTDGQASISAGHPRALRRRRRARGRRACAASPAGAASRSTRTTACVRVELHLVVDWGASIPDVGRSVQARVREYLGAMADVEPAAVDVVVDEIGPAP